MGITFEESDILRSARVTSPLAAATCDRTFVDA
jgi:hypothetical protein